MMVPKNEAWSRKVSETKACRVGRVPESDGWSPCVVPESDGCRKTRLGVLEGYRKASLGVKDGNGQPGLECRNICRRISLDISVDIRNRLLHKYLRKFGQRCRKARLRVEMKVPENDVWSREKGFQIRQIQIPRLVGKQGLSRRNGTESGD